MSGKVVQRNNAAQQTQRILPSTLPLPTRTSSTDHLARVDEHV